MLRFAVSCPTVPGVPKRVCYAEASLCRACVTMNLATSPVQNLHTPVTVTPGVPKSVYYAEFRGIGPSGARSNQKRLLAEGVLH